VNRQRVNYLAALGIQMNNAQMAVAIRNAGDACKDLGIAFGEIAEMLDKVSLDLNTNASVEAGGETVMAALVGGAIGEVMPTKRLDHMRCTGTVVETGLPCVIGEQDVEETSRESYRKILEQLMPVTEWEQSVSWVGEAKSGEPPAVSGG